MVREPGGKFVVGDQGHNTARGLFCSSMVCAALPKPSDISFNVTDFAVSFIEGVVCECLINHSAASQLSVAESGMLPVFIFQIRSPDQAAISKEPHGRGAFVLRGERKGTGGRREWGVKREEGS